MSKILYVPVILEGLVVGKDSAPLADLAPDYSASAEVPLGKYATRLFGTKKELPGIHLHWTMPDALLHGVHRSGEEELRFPALPNRWIVHRFCESGGERGYCSWLIESDFVTNHPAVGLDRYDRTVIPTFRFADGLWQGAGTDGQIYGYQGGARVYGTERQEEGYYLPELTAVGPGDVSFAAFYPKSRSVFGFYDNMENVGEGTYTYLLTGYYSDVAGDPLNGADEAALADLAWSYADSGELPDQTVCHSILRQVEWRGPDQEYPSGVPEGDVRVYMGNTSAEALAALLQEEMPETEKLERLLNAFQNDLLDGLEGSGNPDALLRLEELLHERQFESAERGRVWRLRNTRKETAAAALEAESYEALARINQCQEEKDLLLAKIESLKNEIYFAWWKYVLVESDPWGNDQERFRTEHPELWKDLEAVKNVDSQTFLTLIGELRQELAECQNRLLQNTEELTGLQNSLTEELTQKGMVLEEEQRERFYTANPPVLMFSGEGVKRAYKQGFQRDEQDGLLHCRMNPVSSLTVQIDGQNIVIPAGAAVQACVGQMESLPDFAAALLGEALLLSESCADELAGEALELAGLSDTPEKRGSVKEQICRRQRERSGFAGSFPDSIAVCRWKQPWAPLLMEWRIRMDSARSNIREDDSFRNYSLKEIDYEWNPEETITADAAPVELQGATIISPHAADNLSNLIRRMAETPRQGSEYENLKKAAELAAKLEILSQRMDGFHEALIMRDLLPSLPLYYPSEDLAPLLRELTQLLDQPFISPRVEDLESRFLPVRAGFLSVLEVWLVDSFGQIKKIALRENSLHVGENLKYAGRGGEAYLRPRFMYPAALQFKWLAARKEESGDAAMEAVDNKTTPVIGFVMPNFLDSNLQVYDAEGSLLGFVQKSGQGARWMKLLPSCIAWEEIPSTQLRFFVKRLLGDDNPALAELLKYLDGFLGRTAPAGDEQFLQLCFGKPLVLARGSVQVLGRGAPPHVQWFQKELVCNGVDQERFFVRFGDKRKLYDGFAGFFAGGSGEETYSRLFVPKETLEQQSEYIVQDNRIETSLTDEPAELTFLFDPAGFITISTGFLPAREVSLDGRYYHAQLERSDMYLRAAPLLAAADRMELPVPGGMAGEWSFCHITPEGTAVESEEVHEPAVLPPDMRRQIKEGFLHTIEKEG